jgi:hypothetical protein
MDYQNISVPRVIKIANPAAGGEIVVTPTGRGAWKILSMLLTLTTSAVVANRAVRLEATDTSQPYFRTDADAVQAASLTGLYSAFAGASGAVGASGVAGIAWPTDGLLLPQGHSLATITTAIDVGDQYSAIGLLVIELADIDQKYAHEYGPASPSEGF